MGDLVELWRPMRTAPRDGRWLWLSIRVNGAPREVRGYWFSTTTAAGDTVAGWNTLSGLRDASEPREWKPADPPPHLRLREVLGGLG